MQAALHGAIAAAVAITAKTSWTIARPHFKGRARLRVIVIGAAAFGLYAVGGIPPICCLWARLGRSYRLAAPCRCATPMNVVLLYLLLLKGTLTAFAGLASLPVIQDALWCLHRHVLTAEQPLNEAVVITRSTPGPVGLYIVSVGYFAAGLAGAIAGWLAMITPARLIIPLVHYAGRRMEHPRVREILAGGRHRECWLAARGVYSARP